MRYHVMRCGVGGAPRDGCMFSMCACGGWSALAATRLRDLYVIGTAVLQLARVSALAHTESPYTCACAYMYSN